MKMQNVIILLFIGFSACIGLSQSDELKPIGIYDRNHFSFEFQTGFNTTQFITETGTEEFEDRIENFHLIAGSYHLNFGKYFGLQVRAAFGLQPDVLSFEKTKRLFMPFSGFPAITVTPYSLFARLGLAGVFHKEFKNSEWGIASSAGGAFSIYDGGFVSSGNIWIADNGVANRYNMTSSFEDIPGLILDGSIGVTRALKNNGLLGLYLTGEYHFKPILAGSYLFDDIVSSGRVVNNGSNIGLKLQYSFYKTRRKDVIAEIATDTKNYKVAKQAYKAQKRNTNSENMYVRIGSGYFWGRNINRGNISQLRSSQAISLNHFIRFEKGLSDQYFYEGGLSIENYWLSIKIKDELLIQGENFSATTGSLGYGKRFIRKKTNWHFLTISAGANISFTRDFRGIEGAGSSSFGAPIDWNIEPVGAVEQFPLFFSLYASISHDIRLSDRLSFSVNYRFHQGLNAAVRETVRLTGTPGDFDGDITRKINGTSSAFNVGLKFRLPD